MDTQPQTSQSSEVHDPFDTLLTLEDSLYTSAYAQGTQDGARAGRIEGRIFGLEKGFEKFASLGILHGRASVWGARFPKASSPEPSTEDVGERLISGNAGKETMAEAQSNVTSPQSPALLQSSRNAVLPPSSNPTTRLHRNAHLLYHMTDPLTFDTSNTEDAVADFDDRFKRAGAKAKIIERSFGEHVVRGEDGGEDPGEAQTAGLKEGDEEEVSKRVTGTKNVVRGFRMAREGTWRGKKDDDSMEDFASSRLLR